MANVPPQAERATRTRWLIFSLACATSWFLYLHRYTWNFIRPELQQRYGFSNTELELLFTTFNVSYGIGQVPSGILCDVVGPHRFLGVIILGWSATIPAFGLTGNLAILAGLRFLFGAFQAGCYPALSNVTRRWFPPNTRTIAQGWIASAFGRGGGAMSTLVMGTVLMGWCGLGLTLSLLILSVAGIAFGLVFLRLFRDSPHMHPRVNDAERRLIGGGVQTMAGGPRVLPFDRALKNRSLYFVLLQQASSAGADVVYSSLMGSYFLLAWKLPIEQAGALASMPLLGGACGGIAGGYLNDLFIRITGNRRWSRRGIGACGKFLSASCMMIAISRESALATGVSLFCVKFFTDWSQPTVWGTCTDLGGKYSATVFSIVNTAGTIGGLVTPVAFGMLLDNFTTKELVQGSLVSITNFTPVFLTVAAIDTFSGLTWFGIDCTESLEDPK